MKDITITALNYAQWLTQATQQLNATGMAESPRLDSQLLLQHVTQRNRTFILAFAETELTSAELRQLNVLLQRRMNGEPIAYILGEKEFWSLKLEVSAETLIPRPDTEILVEMALQLAQQRLASSYCGHELSILDLGTGTGAIALALTSELKPLLARQGKTLLVTGVDVEHGAVALAQRNAVRNGMNEVRFLYSDWFTQVNQKFDIIVSNPPYIESTDEHLLCGDVRFEPRSALVALEQGYADLRYIIETAPAYLKPHGWLLLEHGWQQAEKVRSLFQKKDWQHIETIKDYGDNERVTLAQSMIHIMQ